MAKLKDKNLFRNIRPLAIELGEASGHDARLDIFDGGGWETQYIAHIRNSRPRFHAFKNQVVAEYVGDKNRARVRSDLLCLESYYRMDMIDAGIIITERDSEAYLSWINQDLDKGILDDYIFAAPIYLIESAQI